MKPNLHDKVSSCRLSLVSLMLLASPQPLMIPSNISRLAWSLSDFRRLTAVEHRLDRGRSIWPTRAETHQAAPAAPSRTVSEPRLPLTLPSPAKPQPPSRACLSATHAAPDRVNALARPRSATRSTGRQAASTFRLPRDRARKAARRRLDDR